MKLLKLTLQLFLLVVGPVLWADSPAVVSPPVADPLSEALPILQARYPNFPALHYQTGDHLSDLIARSNGKISLAPPDALGSVPILTAVLPDGIAYWRLASFTPRKDWADLANGLKTMIDVQHVGGAVLDLRSTTAPTDYAGAAHVLGLFEPADTTFSKYLPREQTGAVQPTFGLPDREFQGPLIVLINDQTTGAAEALAASLKADGAILVGRSTGEASSLVEEHKLTTGEILRFAVEKPIPAAGSTISGHSLTPDIALSVNDHNEKAALTLIRDNHVLDVIQESAERHRLNEATLVKGQDPELDDYLGSLERKPVLLSLPVIHDVVLISALDGLRAIRLSERPLAAGAVANVPTATSSSSVQ